MRAFKTRRSFRGAQLTAIRVQYMRTNFRLQGIRTFAVWLLMSWLLFGQESFNPTLNNPTVGGSISGVGASAAGTIRIILTGTCGTGWTEITSLNGVTLEGTIAANNDVGTTGGSDTITPTGSNGTVSFTPAGTNNAPAISWPAGVPTFAGSQVTTSAVSAGTPAGTNGTVTGP